MFNPIGRRKSTAVTAVLAVFLLTDPQTLWGMGPERLLPGGTVKVYRGDQLVSVLSQEAPLPEGLMLAPEGRCGLRMENLYLVADSGSRFSVATGNGGRELLVREGTIYFAMSAETGPVTFNTPAGLVTTQQLILNASADGGLLKGYVDASPDGTRIGVLEGGHLVVLTADGEKTIAPGRQIILAQANLFDEETAAEGAEEEIAALEDDDIPAAYFWGGGAALAALGVGVAANNDGGGGGAASPAAP
jgi:hypothetical protein